VVLVSDFSILGQNEESRASEDVNTKCL